ncbi:hypothetical protein GOBAR_AA23160 [Gossypium barbadense]|uniref:Phorbol-ester/DAG-type domain-containing protein n=1 Tax=Gossypium barbadense TaxID=3634 RepID=A0A2P5X2E8_GOSBA|nr:hypothetical protein GOBAR_AA23160 [Gossypium barbadense]
MESQNYGHRHPLLLLLNEDQRIVANCSRCGEKVSTPCFSCAQDCGFYLHKVCAEAPLELNHPFHLDHPLLLMQNAPYSSGEYICDFCDKEDDKFVYHCSCGLDFHIKCALFTFNIAENNLKELEHVALLLPSISTEYGDYLVSLENEDEMPNESSISVIERNDAGEATKIKHFKHKHNLMLGPFVGGYENSCDGSCAELPRMKNVWHHYCQKPLTLISDKRKICLRCVIALTPGSRTCLKPEHPLFYYIKRNGKCNACGYTSGDEAFRCKDCNFVLHRGCFSLPITARHICDEHLLSLIDHDDNSYSKSHHCDICEKSQDTNRWFYHCAICDTSAHVDCVLGKYPFLKLGSIYKETGHPHPLTIVKKYYYPDYDKCSKPCEGVALECSKSECKYIVHWNCVAPYSLQCSLWWGM